MKDLIDDVLELVGSVVELVGSLVGRVAVLAVAGYTGYAAFWVLKLVETNLDWNVWVERGVIGLGLSVAVVAAAALVKKFTD